MGEVWEASDSLLGAVWRSRSSSGAVRDPDSCNASGSSPPGGLARHDGIAAVHDYGESDGVGGRRPRICDELVRGEPLSRTSPADRSSRTRHALLEEPHGAAGGARARLRAPRVKRATSGRTDGKVSSRLRIAKPPTRCGHPLRMVMGTPHYIAPSRPARRGRPGSDVYSRASSDTSVWSAPALPRRERGRGGDDAGPDEPPPLPTGPDRRGS